MFFSVCCYRTWDNYAQNGSILLIKKFKIIFFLGNPFRQNVTQSQLLHLFDSPRAKQNTLHSLGEKKEEEEEETEEILSTKTLF